MAAASHGVTRDKLIWTAAAYIRPETYQVALARIIDAHHALPIATIWGTKDASEREVHNEGQWKHARNGRNDGKTVHNQKAASP